MTQADRIREFVAATIIADARKRGIHRVAVRAGDIHRDLGLTNATPAVCSAIGSKKFSEVAHVTLMHRQGSSAGSNVVFTFSIDSILDIHRNNKPFQEDLVISNNSSVLDRKRYDLRDSLVLISCAKSKLPHSAPARELYASLPFTMARDLVEAQKVRWYILSALYGLVHPRANIDPYDRTLNRLSVAERKSWANGVLEQLLPIAKKVPRIVFFAGQHYREYLVIPLRRQGVVVDVPMEGLRQGEQLAWLSSHQ
ncbi:MAG TPA: hypothetical protein VHC71_05730 [Hyphomicrobium sp.]|nr:hypothetical protein [Hyphomicrobium sp.]